MREMSRSGLSAVTVMVSATVPDSERHVDGGGLADGEDDARLLELLEPLELGGYAISPERQERRAVETSFVGHHLALVAHAEVGHSDGDAG